MSTMAKAPHGLIPILFQAWRRLLTAIARGGGRIWANLRRIEARRLAGWRAVRAYHVDTTCAWSAEHTAKLMAAATFGLRAFMAGLLISIGFALGAGPRVPAALLTVFSELLWAGARVSILLLLLPADSPRSRVLLAFAAGLAPYAFGVTPLLRFAALWPSAILTERGLRGADITPAHVRVATRWAFGGQAAIVMAGLAVRLGIAVLGGI